MTKEYYDRYWRHELPKMSFFDNEPVWDKKTLDQYAKMLSPWLWGSTIIDYGCGQGHLLNRFAQKRWITFGVDISSVVIENAKRTYQACNFHYPSDRIPYVANVISTDVMEHVFDFDEYFKFVRSHLKVRGRLLVVTNEMCFLKFLAIGLFFKDTFHHPYSPHIRFFTKKSLEQLLEMHGFKVIHYQSIGRYYGIGLSKGQFVVAERVK